MNFQCELIAGGCNAVYNGLSLLPGDNCAVYPCANAAMIYDLKKVKVEGSLGVFEKRVNSTKLYLQQGIIHMVAAAGGILS